MCFMNIICFYCVDTGVIQYGMKGNTNQHADIYDGISRVNCFCDPTEATLNGHVPAPPRTSFCPFFSRKTVLFYVLRESLA